MQDTSKKRAPEAHENKYRNDPPVEELPTSGKKRDEKRSPEDPSAGRVDERRHRPGKDSQDER